MLALLWNVLLAAVATFFFAVGLFVAWIVLVNFWRLIKWERQSHEAKETHLFHAVEAAFKAVGLDIERAFASDFAHHPMLPKLIKAANVWLQTHGWPSQFTEKNFAVTLASLKLYMATPGYRMANAIGQAFAPRQTTATATSVSAPDLSGAKG